MADILEALENLVAECREVQRYVYGGGSDDEAQRLSDALTEAERALAADGVTRLDHQTFPRETPTDLYTAEALRVHELCDAAGVPRVTGESLAQRVERLASAYSALVSRTVTRL